MIGDVKCSYRACALLFFVVFLLSGYRHAAADDDSEFHVPQGFSEKGSANVTLFSSPEFHLSHIHYGRWRNSEVIVGGDLGKSKKALVALNDGSFRTVDESAVEIDETSNNLLEANASKYDFRKLVASTLAGRIVISVDPYPLNRHNIFYCTNIPPIVHISTPEQKVGFAPLIKTKDNERCFPEADFYSKYEGFNLSASNIAFSVDRVFLKVGEALLTIPYQVPAITGYSYLITEQKYDEIIDKITAKFTAKAGDDDFSIPADIVPVEKSIEAALSQYQSMEKVNDR